MPMQGTVPVVRERFQNNDTSARESRNTSPGRGTHHTLDHGREAHITRLCLALTLAAWAAAMATFAETLWTQGVALADTAGTLLFMLLFSGLVWGSVVYQLARLGYLRRLARHVPADRETLERRFDDERAPTLTVLIPSY